MLVLLSPSKKLDENSKFPKENLTQPQFMDDTLTLLDHLKKLSAGNLSDLMKLSHKLATLNYERNQSFNTPFTVNNARPALFMFKGDVYDKMDVADYSSSQLAFAQKHIRILSGLYGILRPLDLMQAYRLEMGTKLSNIRGSNLYDFWGADLANYLNADEGGDVVINLASNEYFKAAKEKLVNKRIITIHFKQIKNGQLKTIGLMAKRARGLMANYIIKKAITDSESLKNFNAAGYVYQADASTKNSWVFMMDMDRE